MTGDSRQPERPVGPEAWPALPLQGWQSTYATLHMWSQVVGKVRLALSPKVNHWWHVPLYVTSRGLTTSAIPYRSRSFEIRFDFVDHCLGIEDSEGRTRSLPLAPRSVADVYHELMDALRAMGIGVRSWPMPDEVPGPVRFDEDHAHASYDAEQAHSFWHILMRVDAVFKLFRGAFLGKCSPVNFFWGSFDLCVTRFSGRRAPDRPGADAVTREAYSHEVISHGFWPGGGDVKGAAFYAYAAPEPPGFSDYPVLPATARQDSTFSESLLLSDDVVAARVLAHAHRVIREQEPVGTRIKCREQVAAGALEEVRHVAIDPLALAQLLQERLRHGVLVESVDGSAREVDAVARDEDPPAGALEGHAVLGVMADVHHDVVGERRPDGRAIHAIDRGKGRGLCSLRQKLRLVAAPGCFHVGEQREEAHHRRRQLRRRVRDTPDRQ